MEKENNFEMLDQPGKIAALITKTIVDYCMKSDTPVDIMVRRTGREVYQHDFQSYRQYDE